MCDVTTVNWPATTARLMRHEDLDSATVRAAMGEIMRGAVDPIALSAFLVALHAKGESVVELRALADVMTENARPLDIDGLWLDIVGTGGDMAHTVNISTMAALVCAGAGVKVAKHGNRASSSSTGTADVLEELGVDLAVAPEEIQARVETAEIAFLFAQVFHPAMRHAAPVRKALGVPTAFNFLGPLTNPARPRVSAVGCADLAMAPVMAGVFAERAATAAVFRGDDGLDELTLASTSQVWWVHEGSVHHLVVSPEDVGLSRAPLEALRGGDAPTNAAAVRALLAGQEGPVRDAVLLNAGLALALVAQERSGELFGGAKDLPTAVRKGIDLAVSALDRGAAEAVLRRWVESSTPPARG